MCLELSTQVKWKKEGRRKVGKGKKSNETCEFKIQLETFYFQNTIIYPKFFWEWGAGTAKKT